MKNFLSRILLAATALTIVTIPGSSFAAAPRLTIKQNSQFALTISLVTDQPVNAFDLAIKYPADVVSVQRVDTSRTIVGILAAPIKAQDGLIVIKGGSSTPFVGSGEIATVFVKPIAVGAAVFSLEKGNVYRADGTGAQVAVSLEPHQFAVTQASLDRYQQVAESVVPADTAAPKITIAKIEKNPVADTAPLVVLAAQDSGSGIQEFRARTKSWLAWSDWHEALNPYPLTGGEWAIEIAAVDNSANVVTQILYRPEIAALKGAGALLFLVIAIILVVKVRRRRKTTDAS